MGALQFFIETLEDRVAIESAGQRIVHRFVGQCPFCFDQISLQLHHSSPDTQTRVQFVGIKRFDDVIVGTGIEPGQHVGLVGANGEHDQIGWVGLLRGTDSATELCSIESRHFPVEQGQGRRLRLLHDLPGLFSVFREAGNESPLTQDSVQHDPRGCVVIGNQDLHI